MQNKNATVVAKKEKQIFIESVENTSTEKEKQKNKVENSVNEIESSSDSEHSFTVTAENLLRMGLKEIPTLLNPILPKVGLVALGGSSDTGKSSWLRQFATAISLGENDFLGFKMNLKHKSAIYISSEDDMYSIAVLLGKQNVKKIDDSNFKNLRYVFNADNLVYKLDAELKKRPADLIVVDAFADIFSGDINSTIAVRNFLTQYSALAQKHECLFIFLHHTGKRTDDLSPSKNNLLGSQGFEAKMRLVIELRKDKDEPNHRHLCIVKGNYLPSENKNSSYVLMFDENMLFSNTEKRVPYEKLIKGKNNSQEIVLKQRVHDLKAEGKSVRDMEEIIKKEGLKAGRTKISEMAKNCPSVQNPTNKKKRTKKISSTENSNLEEQIN